MQVSIETTTGLERRLTVGIPAKVVDSEVEKRLKEAAKTVRLNGFRKGKIPMKVVKQRFGAGVRQEVIGDAINKSFYDAVQKESLNPAGQPKIEPKQLDEGKDVEFIATFEVFPEVSVSGLDDLEVTVYEADIEDADVDKMVEVLREGQAEWGDVERAAETKDRVTIDFVGKRDGETFEGGSASDHKLELGSNTMIPGFEDGIVGMSAGDTKTLALTFPDDYQVEDLRGADVEFEVTVKQVEGRELPELNDEFFAKFNVSEGGIEKFKEDVTGNMEREKKKTVRQKTKAQIFDALREANPLELPQAMIDAEINAQRQRMVQQYGASVENLDLEALLPAEMFKEQAEKSSALALLVREIVEQEKMQPDEAVVRGLLEEMASTYEDPDAVINYYQSNKELMENMQSAALEEQVVDFLLEKANVTVAKVSYEEAVKPQQ